MTSLPTEGLVIDATVLHGFLAGGNAVRALVHMPAWRKVGPRAWAAFSRHADLGRGLFLYPFEAIIGAVLSAGAAISFQFDPAALQRAFDGFECWGNVRAAFQVLAFLATVWALMAVLHGLG